jgi:hypothetical protein
MDSAACLKRITGHTPTVLVTTVGPNGNEGAATCATTPTQLFQAASSFWSPTIVQLVPAGVDSPHKNISSIVVQANVDSAEVAVSHWAVKGATANYKNKTFATLAVVQNLEHEQRIIWDTTAQ